MIVRSFKLKIVLLTVLFTGTVLMAFGFFSMSVIYRIGLERIDRELYALGEGHVRRPQPPDHWERFDKSFGSIYGQEGRWQFIIKVNDAQGARIYTSPHWPADLSGTALGVPDTTNALPPPNPPPEDRERWRHEPPDRSPDRSFEPWEHGREPSQRLHAKPATGLTLEADQRTWRFAILGNEEITLMIGQDLAPFYGEVQRFRNAFFVAIPISLLLLTAIGWFLAGQALKPVKVITQTAEGITAKGLDQRVPETNADQEFQKLIHVMNRMLDRLEKSFKQAVRFSADAAHELKTPLTILQGQLEQAIQAAPSGSPEQRNFSELLEEVQRLSIIIRKLLLLSQADSGQLKLGRESIDLSHELDLLARDIPEIAPQLKVQNDIAPDVRVSGDPDLIRQALQNLISNAIKYNRDGGSIELRLQTDNRQALFTISNTTDASSRIDPEQIFERFYRGDKARGRHIDGAGLGLSLAREIVRAHRGTLVLADSRDGMVTFTMTLPLA